MKITQTLIDRKAVSVEPEAVKISQTNNSKENDKITLSKNPESEPLFLGKKPAKYPKKKPNIKVRPSSKKVLEEDPEYKGVESSGPSLTWIFYIGIVIAILVAKTIFIDAAEDTPLKVNRVSGPIYGVAVLNVLQTERQCQVHMLAKRGESPEVSENTCKGMFKVSDQIAANSVWVGMSDKECDYFYEKSACNLVGKKWSIEPSAIGFFDHIRTPTPIYFSGFLQSYVLPNGLPVDLGITTFEKSQIRSENLINLTIPRVLSAKICQKPLFQHAQEYIADKTRNVKFESIGPFGNDGTASAELARGGCSVYKSRKN